MHAAKRRLIGYGLGGVGLAGIIGTALLVASLMPQAEEEPVETESFESQQAHTVTDSYPNAHVGYRQDFWSYGVMTPETTYEERQEALDAGAITLWPAVDDEGLMWLSGHHPGTFSVIAERLKVGETIHLTTPDEYNQRHLYDAPELWTYTIVERLDTDIWAEDVFETTGLRATDMYNEGMDDPFIVLQHSGEEEDSVVLYLGELTEQVDLSAE